jgi:hypothetical protein
MNLLEEQISFSETEFYLAFERVLAALLEIPSSAFAVASPDRS